jgi:hypothetical protein
VSTARLDAALADWTVSGMSVLEPASSGRLLRMGGPGLEPGTSCL